MHNRGASHTGTRPRRSGAGQSTNAPTSTAQLHHMPLRRLDGRPGCTRSAPGPVRGDTLAGFKRDGEVETPVGVLGATRSSEEVNRTLLVRDDAEARWYTSPRKVHPAASPLAHAWSKLADAAEWSAGIPRPLL